jgi:hypothetical protein
VSNREDYAVRIDLLIEPIIEQRLKDGFVPPLRAAIVFANGSIIAFQFRVGGKRAVEGAVLAEYVDPSETTVYPINMLLVDSRGEAVLVMFGPDSQSRAAN